MTTNPDDNAIVARCALLAMAPWLASFDDDEARQIIHLRAHDETEMAREALLLCAMERQLSLNEQQKRQARSAGSLR